MKFLMPIKNINLTDEVVKKIKDNFKYTMFAEGETIIHLTKNNGVHYTGKPTKQKLVCIEVNRNNMYILFSLANYPNGIIVHFYVDYNYLELNKSLIEQTCEKIYNELLSILK